MNNLSRLLSDLNAADPDLKHKCSLIKEEIVSGEYTILNLIEELKPHITNPNHENRAFGIDVLVQVLTSLPKNILNDQQVYVLTTFFSDKLKDHHQVVPCAIKGIVTLLKYNNFPKQNISVILNDLFQHVSCQQQHQNDRYNIYNIFKILVNQFPEEVAAMGNDAILGMINSMEGERDPRNLLFLFKWLKFALKVLNLEDNVDNVFEVLECYFPVDFKAQSNNKEITRDILANELCDCLCSIPEFGDLCISLALDRLDSSFETAKNDSLLLLVKGCENFNTSSYVKRAYEIWSHIQREIFTPLNEQMRKASLNTLSHFIKKISQSDEFNTFLKNTIDSLKGNLLPGDKHFQITIDILQHISMGSTATAKIVLKEISPILINLFNITVTPSSKVDILRAIKQLTVPLDGEDTPEVKTVLSLCFQAISHSNSDLQAEGFNTFKDLILFVSEDYRKILYEHFCDLLPATQPENVRNSILDCFCSFASNHSEEIVTNVINNINFGSNSFNSNYLQAVSKLDMPNFEETVADMLLKCLENNCLANEAILHIKNILKNVEITKICLQKDAIRTLMNFTFRHLNNSSEETLSNISVILRTFIRQLSNVVQKELTDEYLTQICTEVKQCETYIFLLSGLLAALQPDIDINLEVLHTLITLANTAKSKTVREESGLLLANFINKKSADEQVMRQIDIFKSNCVNLMEEYAPITLAWIAKGLVIGNIPYGYSLIDFILKNGQTTAGEAVNLIIKNDFDMLSVENFCHKMPLYRHKVFNYVINKINEYFQDDLESQVLVFGSLLEGAPEQVVITEIKKIAKYILISLRISDKESVLLPNLRVIKSLIVQKNQTVEEHLGDFVSRLLDLTRFEKSMKVRILSLQCLCSLLLSYPKYKLLPLKQDVINQLIVCVDDKKRLVRKEAMETRFQWCLLDSPI